MVSVSLDVIYHGSALDYLWAGLSPEPPALKPLWPGPDVSTW